MTGASLPRIADYGLIGDCHGAALVSRAGSIDWCCLPRFDSGSVFARLLDPERGGHCAVIPAGLDPERTTRAYVGDTLVLATTLHGADGEVVVTDCMTLGERGPRDPRRRLLRIVEGRRGCVPLDIEVVPRFDYGDVRPWLLMHGPGLATATGGDDALELACDHELESGDDFDLHAHAELEPGERLRLSIAYVPPELLDEHGPQQPTPEELDALLDQTVEWWRAWAEHVHDRDVDPEGVMRSALTLKALTYEPTGAIIAAPTTSLPERLGGEANWDYRYSWVRDSSFSSRSLRPLEGALLVGAGPRAAARR